MELIVISKPSFFEGEARLINQLFEAGMPRFHLRKESVEMKTAETFRKTFRDLLTGIDPKYYDRIALHQFHEMACDFNIRSIHYPETERLAGKHHHVLSNRDLTLSTSIHRIKQLTDLENFKYTFYGPVYNSISKKDYPGTISTDFRLQTESATKVIALGGIDLSKVELVRQMNFDGLAILGALWNDPGQAIFNFKMILQKCQADHS